MNKRLFRAVLFCVVWLVSGLLHAQEGPVQNTMDGIVERLSASLSRDELLNLNLAAVEKVVTPEERHTLATEYWTFDVDLPVVVSVMRDTKQAIVPFWLPETGFAKTDLRVRNEGYEYEVWQKKFDAGHVGLGINGFDKNRPHYFVSVGPQEPGATPKLTNFTPADQVVLEMREGSLVYHDWTELVLTEVPDTLKGQQLLPTIRGRAREAHLLGAFRETPSPSSEKPDQVMLTWSEDPRTSQAVQWRTNASVQAGVARYREKGTEAWSEAPAEHITLQDLLLLNDPRINRFTATLRDLKPGTAYEYTVGSPDGARSEPAEFATAPNDGAPFTFVVLSDTHNRPECGALLKTALQQYPSLAFCAVSGDLVGTGQYRDDWDTLFTLTEPFARQRPIMPALGNHDTVDGLGAGLYRSLFALPTNGSTAIPAEQSYSFRYGDAQFIVLDSMSLEKVQAPWLEEQLKNSDAKWKFVLFHFPPYSPSDDEYPEMRQYWCTLIEKYGVDMVFSGHVHYYMRSHPIFEGKPSANGKGTVYMISVAVNGREKTGPAPDYAAVLDASGVPAFVAVTVDGNRAVLRAQDATGKVRDEYIKEKP